MNHKVLSFIKQYCNQCKPILLGLSGGPDSLALLHVLIELMPILNFKLGVAHIDHRWRDTSTEEAFQLRKLAEKLGVPFHLKTLDPALFQGGNLEAICRQERLNFFKQLCTEFGYQGVLLGHHADDQAETVLKKLFEGAPLACMGGLQKEVVIQKLTIWRPFLDVTKSEILKWLKERNSYSAQSMAAIDDYTNRDPRFMRGKFRTSIIPGLSKEFGKEIGPSLNRLALESKELENYLQAQCRDMIDNVKPGPFGFMMDLSSECPTSPLVLRFLLRNLCLKAGVVFSYELLEQAIVLINNRSANKKIKNGKVELLIDRGRLFLLTSNFPVSNNEMKIRLGKFYFGNWLLNVEDFKGDSVPPTNWYDAWQGRAVVVLPAGDYILINPASAQSKLALTKWWTNAKVPAFLRQIMPVIAINGEWIHEFLTGRSKKDLINENVPMQKISHSCYLKLSLDFVRPNLRN